MKFQGSIRSVLPRRVVHPASPQGGFHCFHGHHCEHARGVACHQLAGNTMGQGPHSDFKAQ
jgi:hypothetical protein